MTSNHLILYRPLLLLPSTFPSIRVFSNKSAFCIRWPKHWSLSFNITPSSEHPGLISFRMDRISLQSKGLFKSLLQHHSSKASILWCSAFFTVQLSHAYKTTGQTIALTRWTFVDKVMSLLLNMLSRLVITWLQSPSAVILEPQNIKSDTVSTVSPSISHEVILDIHWKDWCWSSNTWSPDVKNWLFGKDPDAGKYWKQEEKGTTDNEMVGCHHWFDGHEFDKAPGVVDGQGSLACCSPWGLKVLKTTERLNWTG